MANTQHNWYLIYTKVRSEQLAQENLIRQNYHAYLPLVQNKRRRNSRYLGIIEAFFPRYLFIRLNSETDNWAPIRSTIGVAGLVKFGGLPVAVPEGLIESLKANENENGLQQTEQKQLKPGDVVSIIDGPFAGIRCIYQNMKSADRVSVLLNIIGKNTPAILNVNNLQLEAFI